MHNNLEILREIELERVMEALGFTPDKKASDARRTVYQTPVGKISIMQSKFFNFSTNLGSGGAIDLVMHIKGLSFQEAVNLLKNYFQTYTYSEREKIEIPKKKTYSEKEKINIPTPDYSKKDALIEYLHGKRKIPLYLVNTMIDKKAVYPNVLGSAVFLHRSFLPPFRTTGATVRGIYNNFKQTIGNKNEGLFWFGMNNIKEAKYVVLAESPIDIISYAVLKGINQINKCYISLSGISIPSSCIELLKNKNIILAIDNPRYESNAAAKRANIELQEQLKSITVIREIPEHKDWNEDLIKKLEVKKWIIR